MRWGSVPEPGQSQSWWASAAHGSHILAILVGAAGPLRTTTRGPGLGLQDRKRRTKRKTGMVVITMDTVDVHTVVMEKRSGPMLTSVPTLSGE